MAKPGKKLNRTILNGTALARQPLGNEGPACSQPSLPSGYDPCHPEESYREVVDANHRRRFGQYFTPPSIAGLMCEWIAGCAPKEILDPAVGPGIFVRQVLRKIAGAHVTAIDIDRIALEAAERAVPTGKSVDFIRADFLTWVPEVRFDAILANPPYLKHHNYHYEHDVFAEIGRRNGVRLSRLTNIHTLFMVEICRRLRTGGRAAVIVPGEWVNANYSGALKEYFLRNGLLHVLIYFSHSAQVFDDALTTASLILIEKSNRNQDGQNVLVAYVPSAVEAHELDPLVHGRMPRSSRVLAQRLPAMRLLSLKKWDYALSHVGEDVPEGFVPLSVLAKTRRGIATGANAYFHISKNRKDELGIRDSRLLECVGRAADVPSVVFRRSDFERLVRKGARTHLISLDGELDKAESAYVKAGEARGLPERYLLGGRSPWYSMEKREPAPIWAAVFGRKDLRFIYNEMGAYNLTAFHCIYPHNARIRFVKALVAVLNGRRVQDLAKKHRRVYGGGLTKFEPRDLLDILVPDLRLVNDEVRIRLAKSLDHLDAAARASIQETKVALGQIDELVHEAAGQVASIHAGRSPGPGRPLD